jgi:hypothetical protein
MRAMRYGAFLTPLVLAACLPVSAQTLGEWPLRVKVGQFQMRGPASDLQRTHSGFSVDIPKSGLPDGSQWTVGYVRGKSGSVTMETIPILLTKSSEGAAFLPSLPGAYTASGFGAYRVSVTNLGAKFLFGGYVGVGMRIAESLFAELQYHSVSGSLGGYAPNGVSVMVGKRF